MTDLDLSQLLTNPQATIVPVLIFIGAFLKTNQYVPDKYIPLILIGLGIVAGLVFVSVDINGVLAGFVYGITATGGHQAVKQAVSKDTPPTTDEQDR